MYAPATSRTEPGARLRHRGHFEGLSTISKRHALAVFDGVRLGVDTLAALGSGWFAFVIYYKITAGMAFTEVFVFFQSPDLQYAKLAILSGSAFAFLTLIKHGRAPARASKCGLRRILPLWCLTLLLVVAVLYLLKTGDTYSRGWMITWALTTPLFLTAAHRIEWRLVSTLQRAGFARQRLAIVGARPHSDHIRAMLSHADAANAFELIGVFEDQGPDSRGSAHPIAVAGSISDLRQQCLEDHLDAIVIALPGAETVRIRSVVERLMDLPTSILLGPDLAHFELQSRPSAQLGILPAVSLTRFPTRDWSGLTKWLEDRIIAAMATILLAPLLLLTAILIKLDSPGPILFRQKRFGFNNVAFDVYKFRTMYVADTDASGARQTTRNDDRVTPLGRFLRRTSIDELPQLINVLRGDMSIVGPRAHPVGMMVANKPYHELVQHYAARHRVKPGITGLAQVNGNRGEVDTAKKAEHRVHYDLFYIENWSIWLDLSIVLRTVISLPFDRRAY